MRFETEWNQLSRDQAGSKGRDELLHPVNEVLDYNDNDDLSSLVEGVAINEEVGTSRVVVGEDSRSNNKEELKESCDDENICDKLSEVEQGTSYNNSNNLVNEEVVETVIVIETENVNAEGRKLEAKADELGLSLVSMKVTKGVSETDEDSCVIDMKCSSHKGFYENSQCERICRICYLASVQPSDATIVADSATNSDLIQLGCACKDELGIAHIHCAEAWFKLKGNRLCEICGETAKNVCGVANNGFMEEWNERRFMNNDINPSRSFDRCWRGQPFCNFLMACLVIAFVLPWFFRVNMF